jgi:hypothetical protein
MGRNDLLWLLGLFTVSAYGLLLFIAPSPFAAEMLNDPRGFNGIPWGTSLHGRPDLILKAPGDRIQAYERKEGPLPLGQANVDSMRFFTVDGQFARVVVRYHGKTTHEQVLAYLQSRFGASDYRPEQMMRGLNQAHTWRGEESHINLTYEEMSQRGFVFFESRVLAPDFLENIGE